MAKKDKKNNSSRMQPNAPEYQQILHQHNPQPPHNPYYPDPASVIHTSIQQPPPPYSSHLTHSPPVTSSAAIYHSVPMSQLNDISYPRVSHGQSPHVVVQAPGVPYDYRADKYKRKVRSFNNQAMIIAFFAILLSVSAYQMYANRNCINQFVIHKPSKDIEVKISDVRNMHLNIAYASGIVILLCLMRSAFGYHDKTYGCYLLILGLISFFTALNAG
ncbi:Hypothetical predicted protein [Olea europaea subsp. europaea]|uniref:Uncharacterized protein n=1 Tax=Olea europaea subsp. europaea TaxID=158383 RepID=A0A8S0TKH8_OLEEU|nr:Hypothetical predicted protein [Olea europaea subsp. europaea]